MRIALTGGTGFLGRYLIKQLAGAHELRAWTRPQSNHSGLEDLSIEWIDGSLNNPEAARTLVAGCDAVVHAALSRPGMGFRGAEGDLLTFLENNFLGTIRLIEEARAAAVERFIFISTCAVHEVILADRALDERHPLWPTSHYGAHKAAIEKFIHSFGLGAGYSVCSLRPTGIYGAAHPIEHSKWYGLIRSVADGADVQCERGGKEVHAADVARAVELLLSADNIAGQSYNCYDRYISEYEVAQLVKELTDSSSTVSGAARQPQHQIDTQKLRALGMEFGGRELLRQSIQQILAVEP